MCKQHWSKNVRSTTLLLHPDDDVLVAKTDLKAGTSVETESGPAVLPKDIPAGHKIACRDRAVGDPIFRYGQIIGLASAPIHAGDHVHVHNLSGGNMKREYDRISEDARMSSAPPADPTRTFDGFLRGDGRVGTRNYIAIISTVNCSATACRFAADRFRDVSRKFPNVDGVVALTHKGGCGCIHDGEGDRLLKEVLANYATHPNIGGYVLVGLGCEVNQPEDLARGHNLKNPDGTAPIIISVQQSGGTRKTIELIEAEVNKLLPEVNKAERTPQPLSKLLVATNCGGSDSYSGITANPALGCAVDEIVRHGGTALLGETTEIVGAEQLLVRRAVNEKVAQRLLDYIQWWRENLQSHGGDVDENPSPGNMEGGITTVLEKALGGVSKGGTTPLVDVVGYGTRVDAKGFVYMDTPAYDPVSVTGMIAGGANVVVFTTGRGSVYGSKGVPTIKLASNTEMYERMEEDMDINCGVVLNGTSLEELGGRILDEIIAVASGKRTKSETSDIGEEEFAPWIKGPTL